MPTPKTGTIAASETWGDATNPGPIQLTGNVIIAAGAVVRILPAVEILAQGAFSLRVEGALVAGGQRRSRIVFRSDSGARGAWTGLVWAGGGQDSLLEYADVLDALKGLEPTIAPGPKIRAFRSRFENCDIGVSNGLSSLVMEKCICERNRVGLSSSGSWGVDQMTDCRVRNNEIGLDLLSGTLTIPNQRNRIYDNAIGVRTAGGSVLNADGVWWGSDTGPQHSSVAGGLGDLITGAGTVDVTPWTELTLYAPKPEELRTFCDRILKEAGTAGTESLEAALDDDELERILKRAQGDVDAWYDDYRREKPLFARGVETQEELDTMRRITGTHFGVMGYGHVGHGYLHVRYWPIRTVTQVERRFGSAWESMPNDEWSGWFASKDMKDLGVIHVGPMPSSQMSSYRVSYTHGYDTIPEQLKDAAIKVAALEVFHAIMLPGAADVYALRSQPLRDEVAGMAKRARSNRIGWAV